MLKHVGKYYPPRGLRKETEQIEHLHSPNRPHQVATELGPAPGNRQLPRRPGLQGSDCFAPGSTCALDTHYTHCFYLFVYLLFICCLSVFYLFVSVSYLFLSVVICLIWFYLFFSVVYLFVYLFLGLPLMTSDHRNLPLDPRVVGCLWGAFFDACQHKLSSLPFFLGRHRPGCPPKIATPMGGASTSASRFSQNETCTKLPGTISV